MGIIATHELTRKYRTYEKEPGLKGSLRNLIPRKYTDKWAVDSVSLSIDEGEMVGFLGPNGTGKTTLLKMLTGLIHPSSGEAHVMGFVPWERRNEFRRQYALVMGQKSQVWTDIPAIETFHLCREIYQIDRRQFTRALDELVSVLDVGGVLKTQVRRLSLGERMKMELIAALLHQPRVLFLDEPTIGLDVVSQQKIRDFLRYHNREHHTTVLLTSHYMRDIQDLCKRVIIIDRGTVFYDGHLAEIVQRYPIGVYPQPWRTIFTVTLPMVLVANVPAHFALNRVSVFEVAWFVLVGAILVYASMRFWKFGLRRYQGASS